MEWGGGEASRWGRVWDGGRVAGVGGHGRRFLGDGRRSGSHALRETVSVEVAELPELETQRRNWVDEGGRPQPHTQVCVCVCVCVCVYYYKYIYFTNNMNLWRVSQDIRAGGGGREWDQVGGSGRRVEQRPVASVAAIQVVEHQETSSQSQGHPLQW